MAGTIAIGEEGVAICGKVVGRDPFSSLASSPSIVVESTHGVIL